MGLDPITGEKQLTLDMSSVDKKCPKPSRNTIYFGRTLYNIVMYEATTGNKWNISFSEYASGSSSTVENYGGLAGLIRDWIVNFLIPLYVNTYLVYSLSIVNFSVFFFFFFFFFSLVVYLQLSCLDLRV